MDAKIAFVILMMATVAVNGFANAEKESVEDKFAAEKESVEGKVAVENKLAGKVAAENEMVEGDVAKKIKELTHDLEDTRREVKMLNAHNHVDKRGQKLRRIVRSETQSALQEMEEKLEGKAESIEATGQKKDTALLRAADDKFQQLEKKINKVVKTLTEKIDASAKDLAAQIDSSKKTLKTQVEESLSAKIESSAESLTTEIKSSAESLTTKIESSAESLKNTQTEVNNLKSAVANQLRCLSGFTNKDCPSGTTGSYITICKYPCSARVTFSPAFAGTPDLSFALFADKFWMNSRSVKPTHFDIDLGRYPCGERVNIQWMACGVPKRDMTDNMLVEFLRFYQ